MDNGTKRKKALMILNPVAGKGKKKQAFWNFADFLWERGWNVDVHITQRAGDAYAFVGQYAANCALLVSCGGDGTMSETVGGMLAFGVKAPLYHIPLGTTNDMAKTLKLPRSGRGIAALHREGGLLPVSVDAGLWDGKDVFTYVAAFGAFTEISYLTSQAAKNRYGYTAYLQSGLACLRNLKPYEATVITDTAVYRGRYIYGSMSNSTTIGGFLHLKESEVSLSDGKFELLLIRYPESPGDWLRILSGLATHRFDGRHLVLESASKAKFAFDEPVAWTLDGEGAGRHGRVEIGVIQDAYHIYTHAAKTRVGYRALHSGDPA